jgi:2-dehydro-3-deoxyphosphogluconate aldolase/(4S)-4-hydroxy-2-oxoglutarate aldolase
MTADRRSSDGPELDATVEQLGRIGIVPVVEIPHASAAIPLADALLEAGVGSVEITFRTAAGGEALAAIRRQRPELLAGAGTVLRPDQLQTAIEAGARFIVSPGFSQSIVDGALAAGVPVIPGVATATEVQRALEAGLNVLKLFPAEPIGGVPYLRALGAPFPEVRFVPTGGVSAANAASYLELPNVLAIGGSWFVRKAWLADGDYASIRQHAAEAATIVARVRGVG